MEGKKWRGKIVKKKLYTEGKKKKRRKIESEKRTSERKGKCENGNGSDGKERKEENEKIITEEKGKREKIK